MSRGPRAHRDSWAHAYRVPPPRHTGEKKAGKDERSPELDASLVAELDPTPAPHQIQRSLDTPEHHVVDEEALRLQELMDI